MSDCSTHAWHVPSEREPGVLYDHGQPNYDYLQARAIVIGGVRFERVRTCEWKLKHSGTLYDKWCCSECGFQFVEPRCDQGYTDLEPNYCPNCGREVVNA